MHAKLEVRGMEDHLQNEGEFKNLTESVNHKGMREKYGARKGNDFIRNVHWSLRLSNGTFCNVRDGSKFDKLRKKTSSADLI